MAERNRIQGHGGSVAEAGKGVFENVAEKAQGAVAAVGEAAGDMKETVQKWASSAGEGAAHAAEAVGEWASDAAGMAGGALKGAGGEVTQFVRRYPIPALAIAFMAGYLCSKACSSS